MKDLHERSKAARELLGFLVGAVLLALIVGFAAGMTLVMAKFQLTFGIAAGLVGAVSCVLFLTGYLLFKFKRLLNV